MDFSIFFLLDQQRYQKKTHSVTAMHQQLIHQSVLAEQLGYGGVYIAEHHVQPYGLAPSPITLLSWIGAKTQRLKLGTAMSILLLHQPLRLGADFATLDIL